MGQEAKWSELHEVCAVGDSDLLEEMLSSGKYEFINFKDSDWEDRTPLHWCCIKGKSDMAMNLLEKGAHPGIRSSSGWTPAHFAAEGGKTHVLRMLHQYNAPMDRKDADGDIPRRIAEIYGHYDAVDFLAGAEREYRMWRRKAELCGEVDPGDDEDLEWCRMNNVEPEKFITEDELAEINSTVTTTSVSESLTSNSKTRNKYRHHKSSRNGSIKRGSVESRKPNSGKTNKHKKKNANKTESGNKKK